MEPKTRQEHVEQLGASLRWALNEALWIYQTQSLSGGTYWCRYCKGPNVKVKPKLIGDFDHDAGCPVRKAARLCGALYLKGDAP